MSYSLKSWRIIVPRANGEAGISMFTVKMDSGLQYG